MKKIIIMFLFVAAAVACDKMNDLHQPYLDRGETVYAARVDSAKTLIGVNKQLLKVYAPKKRVATGVVKWNLGADSLAFDFPENYESPLDVEVNGLAEGNYTYEIFTYDEFGNRSIGFEVTSNVISQETMDDMVNNLKLSAYYREYDNLLVGGFVQAKIGNAQLWSGQYAFTWDVIPNPGGVVILTYLNAEGNSTEKRYTYEEIKDRLGQWDFISDNRQIKEQPFTYQTVYEMEYEFETELDLGEEYIDRYYTYKDKIEVYKEFPVINDNF